MMKVVRDSCVYVLGWGWLRVQTAGPACITPPSGRRSEHALPDQVTVLGVCFISVSLPSLLASPCEEAITVGETEAGTSLDLPKAPENIWLSQD